MVERCSSTASTAVGLGGMAQQGLGSTRKMMDAQGGGAVWHRGGVDGRSGKFDAWIPILKMSLRKMEAATSGVCDGARSGYAGPVGAPGSLVCDLGRPLAFR
jgi:hypothetical protein